MKEKRRTKKIRSAPLLAVKKRIRASKKTHSSLNFKAETTKIVFIVNFAYIQIQFFTWALEHLNSPKKKRNFISNFEHKFFIWLVIRSSNQIKSTNKEIKHFGFGFPFFRLNSCKQTSFIENQLFLAWLLRKWFLQVSFCSLLIRFDFLRRLFVSSVRLLNCLMHGNKPCHQAMYYNTLLALVRFLME